MEDNFNEQISSILKNAGNVVTLQGRSGRMLEVDVSKEACAQVNFFFLERVLTARGEATVIGTAYRPEFNKRYLHVILDLDDIYISFWDNGFTKEELTRDCGFKKIPSQKVPNEVKVVLLRALSVSPDIAKRILGYELPPQEPRKYKPIPFAVECPICKKKIPEGDMFAHLDLHKESKLETSDSNFDFRTSDVVFKSLINIAAPSNANMNVNSAYKSPKDSEIIAIFQRNISPENADILREIIPKMVKKEFRTEFFDHLSPSIWEKIYATYFAMNSSNLELEVSVDIFLFSLTLSEKFQLNKLKNILAPVILRNNNLYNVLAVASQDPELLPVYQFGIDALANTDLVKIAQDTHFTIQDPTLQRNIIDSVNIRYQELKQNKKESKRSKENVDEDDEMNFYSDPEPMSDNEDEEEDIEYVYKGGKDEED